MLHSEAIWGNGTTEYALDALLAASKGEQYECPVEPDVTLPMIFVDDLVRPTGFEAGAFSIELTGCVSSPPARRCEGC